MDWRSFACVSAIMVLTVEKIRKKQKGDPQYVGTTQDIIDSIEETIPEIVKHVISKLNRDYKIRITGNLVDFISGGIYWFGSTSIDYDCYYLGDCEQEDPEKIKKCNECEYSV